MADADPTRRTRDDALARWKPRYVAAGTMPRKVRDGYVLVHNQVQHEPTTQVGVRGFRAWMQPVADDSLPLVKCDCGWAARAGVHYRVDRPDGE